MAVEDRGSRQVPITEPHQKTDLAATISTKADELLAKFGGPTPNELLAAHGVSMMPDNSVGIKIRENRTGGEFVVRLFQKLVPGSRALFIEYPYMKGQTKEETTPRQLFYVFDLDETSWGLPVEDQERLNKRNRRQAAQYLRLIEEHAVPQ